MNAVTFPQPKLVTECLNADQTGQLVGLLRALKECADQAVVEIRDETGALLGCFVPHTEGVSPLPPEDSPEFLEEMERRRRSPEPALPVETVLEYLRAHLD